jgi:hypothetical protein
MCADEVLISAKQGVFPEPELGEDAGWDQVPEAMKAARM